MSELKPFLMAVLATVVGLALYAYFMKPAAATTTAAPGDPPAGS